MIEGVALVVAHVVSVALAIVGTMIDNTFLVGSAAWLSGFTFALVLSERVLRRDRYQPRRLDSLRDHVPPPLP